MSNKIKIANKLFKAIVAITDKEKANGLMNKEWPPPAMAFPFNKKAIRNFWMKDTPSPLDIIFCRDGAIISISSGEPYSLEYISSNELSDLVIELPKGTVKSNGFKIGDKVAIIYDIKTLSKKFSSKYFIDNLTISS